MKVIIGKPKDWFGPHQFLSMFFFFLPKKWFNAAFDWMELHWPRKVFHWIDGHRKQKIKIHLDSWDTWGVDETLTPIILTLLKKLKEEKVGASPVDQEDVAHIPELRGTLTKNRLTDDLMQKQWDYVLDSMIWSFEELSLPPGSMFTSDGTYTLEDYKKWESEVERGLIYFGKYYTSLWS